MNAAVTVSEMDGARASLAGPSDYLALLKPRVMSLVVFTSLAAMIAAPGSLHPVIAVIALLCVALSIFVHSASRGRLARSNLVLKEVSTRANAENALHFFVGKEGVARTALRPAGIAEFDGVKLNVLTEGEFIDVGKRVSVSRVEGNRIVVAEIAGE